MQVAILQPTFLPWLGWFDIVDQADILIILDDVAFSKRSWQQRNQLRTSRGLEFVTVPVYSAGMYGQAINEVQIVSENFLTKFDRTLTTNYSKAPYFSFLQESFHSELKAGIESKNLSLLNTTLISWFMRQLGLTTPIVSSGSLLTQGKRGEYMAALCKEVGASTYLSPAGAEEYLKEDRHEFTHRNLQIRLHEYSHPTYKQVFNPFLPYASTLDLIFNSGESSLEIIRSGRCLSREI